MEKYTRLIYGRVNIVKMSITPKYMYIGPAVWHVKSQFPDQGLNPCLQHWTCAVLTIGRPGSP